jgi:2-hydroxy-6-oxonona-2,4-dienedioate hydrolase
MNSSRNDRVRRVAAIAAFLGIVLACCFVVWRFALDVGEARKRAQQGSGLAQTRCGAIEYQEAGSGIPLLVVHGSGGGHDQGMAFANKLATRGVRVIAMSRFGYLRTPMPADGPPEAQADAHACLLDALGIARASVLGVSAGAPSATQMAIRHPHRVDALVLVVPIAYKPVSVEHSVAPLAAWAEAILMQFIGSDFLYWTATKIARDQVVKYVLATPPELLSFAGADERARVDAMIEQILPVSIRAQGLRDDSVLGSKLRAYALTAIRAPTLIVSARDDRFGTYAAAQYTANQIAGSKFIGYEKGGHVLVGYDEELQSEILMWLGRSSKR